MKWLESSILFARRVGYDKEWLVMFSEHEQEKGG